jgi:hypothetical protein
MIPAERERHAVDEHGGLARIGATHRELYLAARVLAHEHERHLAEYLLEDRCRRHVQRVDTEDDRAGTADRRRRTRARDNDAGDTRGISCGVAPPCGVARLLRARRGARHERKRRAHHGDLRAGHDPHREFHKYGRES